MDKPGVGTLKAVAGGVSGKFREGCGAWILAFEFFMIFRGINLGKNKLMQGQTLTPQQVREMQKSFDFSKDQASR